MYLEGDGLGLFETRNRFYELGRDQKEPVSRHCLDICLDIPPKRRKHRATSAGHPENIRTVYSPNASLQHYRLTNLLGFNSVTHMSII